MLRDSHLGVKEVLQELMVIVLQDERQCCVKYIGTPIGGELRDLLLGCDACLEQLVVTCVGSSYDVSVVASDAALNEEAILRVLSVLVELYKLHEGVPLALLELGGALWGLFGLRLCLGLACAYLSLLDGA